MKKITFLGLFLALFCGRLVAGSASTVFDFLRADVGPRAAAMGGSFLTMGEDPNILFYNPAGLATLSTRKISFGFFKHLMDINSGHASFATQVAGLGTIGAGIIYTNYGSFKQTGTQGEDLGTFGANDIGATLGYAGELNPNLLYGASAKFIYSSIAGYGSTGAAIDLGVRYVAVPNRIVLAASLLNLGTQIDPYLTTREDMPTDLRIGIMLMPEHLPAVLLFDIHSLNDKQDTFTGRFRAFSLGVEFAASENFRLRGGYDNAGRQDLKIGSGSGLAGLSLGAGLIAEPYSFDYSFNSLGKVGSLHRVSISTSF